MSPPIRTLILAVALAAPSAAFAQGYRAGPPVPEPLAPGWSYGLTPPLPLGVDTGGDMDKRPDLAPYQRGGGQQTGGPARNLIPGDNLHIFPRSPAGVTVRLER